MLIQVLVAMTFFLGSACLAEQPSYITFPSDISWKSQESHHFTAVFREGREDLALKVLSAAEKAHSVLSPIFPEGPSQTYIVIADFRDSLNGYALNFPYSHIVFFATPPSAGSQLASLDDWIYSVILHEYVHILHIYPASGLWKLMRTIFGTWVVPNGMMPSHLHEGLATFLETEKTQGGRGRSSFFSMFRRAAVDEKIWGNYFAPLDLLDGSATRWPHGNSAYFFGYELYQELWSQKGSEGIHQLTDQYSSNLPYFISRPLEKTFGSDYPTLWSSIFEKEKNKTLGEIEQIKKDPISKLTYITENRSFKNGLVFSPDKSQIAFIAETPKEVAAIYTLDLARKKKTRITEIGDIGFPNLCWFGKTGAQKLIYISTRPQYGYALNDLFSFDLNQNKNAKINIQNKKNLRVHNLACSPDENSILVYVDESDQGKVLELNPSSNPDESWVVKREWQVPERQWVTSLIAGKTNWIGLRDQMATHLYQWEKDSPIKVATIPAEVFHLKLVANEPFIEAIADLNGRYEIWEIDTVKKEMALKARFLNGINSFDKKDNSYLVTAYRHGGFDIAWAEPIDSKRIPIPEIEKPSPLPEKLTQVSPPQPYSPLGTLTPRTWVPSLLFVPDGAQIGAWIPGFDLTQKHLYDIFGGYDTRGLPFANLLYTYRFGKSSSVFSSVNFSPSYLRVSKSFFKRWGGRVGYSQELPWGLPILSVGAIFNRLESSPLGPAEQSIGIELGLTKLWGFPQRKLAISPVNGVRASISHAQYAKAFGSNNNFFTTVASLNSYIESPLLKDSVFFMANKIGYTEGSSFINSFFEGGGELLFSQGRGFFLNRGFFPSLFAGRRMFSTNLEYRFPITRVDRGFRLLPIFLSSIHGALVADTLSYDRGPSHPTFPKNLLKVFYTSCGLELKSDWKLGYYLPAQMRVGAYHGFGKFGEDLYLTFAVEAGL